MKKPHRFGRVSTKEAMKAAFDDMRKEKDAILTDYVSLVTYEKNLRMLNKQIRLKLI